MSWQLILYGGGRDGDKDVRGGGVGSSDWLSESVDSVLDLLSNSYSNSDVSPL